MEPTQPTPPNPTPTPNETPAASAAPAPQPAPQPLQAAAPAQPGTVPNLENVTINTASVESKVGLYTNITFIALWILVLVICGFLTALIHGGGGGAAVFFISVAIIATPVFVISNSKRTKELSNNPALIEDVFVKKYLRKNLFTSVVATSIAAFYFVWILLSTLFLKDNGTSDDSGKAIITALVYTLGFGAILAFCWGLHAKTSK